MEAGIVATIVAAIGALTAYLRTGKGRGQLATLLRRVFNIDPTSDDLRAAVENMSAVVDAQGRSIAWLTEQHDELLAQLEQAKKDLAEARAEHSALQELRQENAALKIRINDLENQVHALEDELARRKKYTRKAYRGEGS
jgi:chromosome segregation ATPase